MRIEIDREEDGRWIAEIPDLSGVMVYGVTRQETISKAEALALRVIADSTTAKRCLLPDVLLPVERCSCAVFPAFFQQPSRRERPGRTGALKDETMRRSPQLSTKNDVRRKAI